MILTTLKKTILIIDDDPILAELFDEILNPVFTIKTACNVPDAITILQSASIDIVISDYHLGAQTADDLLDWILQGDSGLAARTILMSGEIAITSRHRHEIADIFLKPVDFDTVIQAVNDLFDQPRREQA